MPIEELDFDTLGKIRKLAKIDKEFGQKLSATDIFQDQEGFVELWKMCEDAAKLLDEISNILAGRSHIVAQDQTTTGILDKIRCQGEFKTITFMNYLMKATGNMPEEFDLYHDAALEEFLAENDHIKYYIRKRKLGALISGRRPPEEVQKYYIEIKEAYALDLRRSCVALCRALLEMSLQRKLKNPPGKLSGMIAQAEKFNQLPEGLVDKAKMVKKEADEILHLLSKNEGPPSSLEDIILNTLDVVEHLLGRLK